ncbi:MAG: regulatory protein GemA [Burkholderiales bacterium]|nr:regulatory protein GemA [Burkholderiales bacterium]
MSKVVDADRRRRDIARIHILAKTLGLSEDERRDVMFAIAQKRSCSDLDFTGLARVRAHLEQRAVATGKMEPRRPGRPRSMHDRDRGPMLRKIEALLLDADRPWNYAHAMAKRMFHVDRVDFLTSYQLHGLVIALVQDQKRRQRAAAATPE